MEVKMNTVIVPHPSPVIDVDECEVQRMPPFEPIGNPQPKLEPDTHDAWILATQEEPARSILKELAEVAADASPPPVVRQEPLCPTTPATAPPAPVPIHRQQACCPLPDFPFTDLPMPRAREPEVDLTTLSVLLLGTFVIGTTLGVLFNRALSSKPAVTVAA